MRKEIDRLFIVLAFQVMGWPHGNFDHSVALSFHEGSVPFHL